VEELGYVFPNPAIQNNRTYSFVARDVQQVGELMLDPFEDVEVVLYPLDEVPRLLAAGAIRHSLVVSAFAMLGVAAARP
jgi:ADP-ribose pyrophosphatase